MTVSLHNNILHREDDECLTLYCLQEAEDQYLKLEHLGNVLTKLTKLPGDLVHGSDISSP